MNPKLNKLFSLSIFQKNILTLFKGTVLAQLIGFLSTFFLAKIYGSEAYGILGLYVSISSAISRGGTLQLEYSLISTENKKELTKTILSIALIILILILLLFSLSLFLNLVKEKDYSLLFIIIISSLPIAFSKVFEFYFTSIKKFKIIANAKIITTSLNFIFQLSFYSFFKLKGLAFGSIISVIFTALYYWSKYGDIDLLEFKVKKIKNYIRNNLSIIKHLLPASIINIISINIMPLFFISLFGLQQFGVYSLSMKILSIPLYILTSSIANVYYQKAKDLNLISKQKLYDLTKKIIITNLVLMLVFLLFTNTIGIYLLELFFSKEWENLKIFTLISSFLILSKVSFNPIGEIMIVINKTKVSLYLNIYTFIISLLAILIAQFYNEIIYALLIISIFGGFGYLYASKYCLRKLKQTIKKEVPL